MVKPLLLAAALATSGQLADSPLSPSGLTGVQLAALLGGLPGALPTASDPADDILPRSGQIGVQPAAPPAGEAGALIQQVLPDSTAARLGIEAGDRIVKIDGTAINDVPALFEAAGKLTANAPITVSFVRAGETRTARGAVAPRPPEEPVVGRVRYDQIEHAGGRLRVLVNAP
ncbi:MAG: PDZ domain-containing protein, partial [Pseudomonadota bacterium]